QDNRIHVLAPDKKASSAWMANHLTGRLRQPRRDLQTGLGAREGARERLTMSGNRDGSVSHRHSFPSGPGTLLQTERLFGPGDRNLTRLSRRRSDLLTTEIFAAQFTTVNPALGAAPQKAVIC